DWLGADVLQYGGGLARLGQGEYVMLIRSQGTNQGSADRTARTGDQNSHRAPLQAATRSLVVDRDQGAVIGDDGAEQERRLGLARVGADDVVGVGRLGPALAGAVDAEGFALDLGADGARDDIREDEAGGGMAVRRREAARAVVHLDDREGLARDIGQLLAEDLLHGLPFAGRGRLTRRVRS